MSIEARLREALAARAASITPVEGHPYERISGAIARNRSRRRAVTATAVAAVAAIAIGLPTAMSRLDDQALPAGQHQNQPLPDAENPMWDSVRTWPTRGSLAGDAAFLDGVQMRRAGFVIFAGDVGTDRVVLVAIDDVRDEAAIDDATVPDTVDVLTYIGPRGAPAADLRAGLGITTVGVGVIAVRRDATSDAWLLVLRPLGFPNGEFSPGVVVERDGTITRSPWQPVSLSNGVAFMPLRAAPSSMARLRIGGYDGGVWQTLETPTPDPAVNPVTICADTCPDFERKASAAVDHEVAETFGLTTDEVVTTVAHVGPVDPAVAAATGITDAGAANTQILVAHTQLPTGAVVRSAIIMSSTTAGGRGTSSELEHVLPIDAATAEGRPFAIVGVSHGTTEKTIAQVFAPRASSVRLTTDTPDTYPSSAKVPIVDGAARLELASVVENARLVIATYDSSGRELGRWPVDPPNEDDPFSVNPAVPQ